MAEWYDEENLRRAWHFVKLDARDNFIFDVIDHQDIKFDIDLVLQHLETKLRLKQYHPSPALQIAVPKNNHSVRPGITFSLVDMIVLYALMQQLAPALDRKLSHSAFAYRLNPRHADKRQPLFNEGQSPNQDQDKEETKTHRQVNEAEENETNDFELDFPYNWFLNWMEFRAASDNAIEKYDWVAITDITAFFENISLDILFSTIRTNIGENSYYQYLTTRLENMLNYWDWSCADSKIRGRGLPQGNDASSFLSNIYLLPLDSEVLTIVDETKYLRYVDDIKLYTSNYDEARRGLLRIEKTLRTLGLNVQSAKTRIVPKSEMLAPDVREWDDKLGGDNPDRLEHAREFIATLASDSADSLAKFSTAYRRSLTVLAEHRDDVAVPVALDMFCKDPSQKMLRKNFIYLRGFVSSHFYDDHLYAALAAGDKFDYHCAFLYRLASYSRGEHNELLQQAICDATDEKLGWFPRVAALMFLSSVALQPHQLDYMAQIFKREGNAQILRAAYVVACQHHATELNFILNQLSYFSAPQQEYLYRYFSQLVHSQRSGQRALKNFARANVNEPLFINHLHVLDLVKANSACRVQFHEILTEKSAEVDRTKWPRLWTRVYAIVDSFIKNP